jgi:LacI family transcriptional regulator
MVTQEQIASRLGLSRQLVTFALAGYPQVGKASRARILAAASEMGYRPNPHARALKRGRTGIIGLWIPDQISSHYTNVTRELSRLAKKAGQELVVSEIGGGTGELVLSNVPVDAVFAVDSPRAVRHHLGSAFGSSTPIICLGVDACEKADCVQVDLRAGTRLVMEHLLGSGLRRIVHATFVRRNELGAGRRIAYVKAMRRAGLKPEFLYYPLSPEQRPIVRRLITRFIRAHGCPEAVFCHSDDVALGIYRGLCDLHIPVPEKVALVGCDGIQDTEYLECPLTTLVQPVAEMCALAWKFLVRRLQNLRLARQQAVLAAVLLIRQSSRRPASTKVLARTGPIVPTS